MKTKKKIENREIILKDRYQKFNNLIASLSLALAGILSGSFVDKAKADRVSPTPRNLVFSPVYYNIPTNVWHYALDGDDQSINRIKDGLKSFLEKELGKKYNQVDYSCLVNDLTKFLLDVYNKDITFDRFIVDYLKIFKKYNISKADALQILIQMINERIISNDILQNVDISERLSISLKDIKNFYGKKEFDKKLREIINLSLKGQLTVNSLKFIFRDYLEYKKKLGYVEMYFFIVLLFILGIITGLFIKLIKEDMF